MKHNTISFISLISILFIIGGCDKFKGDTGPAGPKLTGDLIGFSYLYDENNNRATDNSGITITVEGTNIVATTTPDGYWALTGLTTGTYTYSFSKAGYGTKKSIDAQFVGGGQVYYGSASLFQIPSFTVTNFSDSISNGYIYLWGTLSGTLPTNVTFLRYFIGTSSTVSSDPKNYIFTYESGASKQYLFPTILTKANFNNYGISSGQTVYIVAYAESYQSSSYIDFSTGNFYYTTINPTPSNVVSIVVPQ